MRGGGCDDIMAVAAAAADAAADATAAGGHVAGNSVAAADAAATVGVQEAATGSQLWWLSLSLHPSGSIAAAHSVCFSPLLPEPAAASCQVL